MMTDIFFYRIVYVIESRMRFLSHKEVMRVIARAFRRACLPLAYSSGYHPHPRISYGPPRPVGMASMVEELDVVCTQEVSCTDVSASVTRELPRGMHVRGVTCSATRPQKSITSSVCAAEYLCTFPQECTVTAEACTRLLSCRQLMYTRMTPRGNKDVDLRPGIYTLSCVPDGVKMILACTSSVYIRPQEVLGLLTDMTPDALRRITVTRTALLRSVPSAVTPETDEERNIN